MTEGGASWTVQRGDCLQLLPGLPDDSVDMLISDPPYSSGGQFRGDRMAGTNEKYVTKTYGLLHKRPDFAGDNRDQRAFLTWCHLWLSESLRIVKPGGLAVLFVDWRQLPTLTDAVQVGGWVWRGVCVWDKTAGVRPQLGRYRQQAEFVVWASRGPMANAGPVVDGVFKYPRLAVDRLHSTGKPVPLMRDLLKLAPPGGVVLDPFMGSGSTGVAALQSGRQFLGFELNPEIYRLAAARLRQAESGAPDGDPFKVAV